MTGEQLLKLQEKISADNVDSFYHWKDMGADCGGDGLQLPLGIKAPWEGFKKF